MKRLVLTTLASALCATSALSMPTSAELKKAQPLVEELMAPSIAEFKAAGAKDKAAVAVKVADKSAEFAQSAETEAAKFLLLKGAVSFYTRGEAYDKAADMVTALQASVKDVPPEVIAEITGKATGRISETKAPRLFALYRAAKLQVRAASEAKSLAAKLKKVKSDALQRKYAEVLAVSGDWKKAYGEFAKLSDAKLKAVVDAEAKGEAKNAVSGEFWWTYEPAMEEVDDVFKAHAAAFYRKALDAGEITGLKKNIVEQRLNQIEPTLAAGAEKEGAGSAQGAAGASGKVDGKAIFEAVSKLNNGNEKIRTVVGMLFPGWTLENTDVGDDFGGFRADHRGQDNVIVTHPPNQKTPVVISRTVKLSGKNPCLFLKVSSFDTNFDCLLGVRVDGADVLPFRLIGTLDFDPWEDLVVPLSAWCGREVKIEIIQKANNWYCEHLFFSRIEIAEGNGSEKCGPVGVKELKAKVGSYTWSYRVKNGDAMIVSTDNGAYQCAVSPKPAGHIVIPEKLGGVKVTWIGRRALRDCDGMKSVKIPEGVTHIENDAFGRCVGLTEVSFPTTVVSFSCGPFVDCKELSSFAIPQGVKNIGMWAFAGTKVKSLTIPTGVKKINASAFACCHALASVTMGDEVPDADKGIFDDCPMLKVIHVPAKAKSWAGMKEWQGRPLVFDAGKFCTTSTEDALKTATVGGFTWSYRMNGGEATIEQVRDGNGNPQCAVSPKPTGSFTIPSTLGGVKVTGLGEHAFFGCGGLTSVVIPPSVRSVGNGAFYFCSGLKSISIPSSVTSLTGDGGSTVAFTALNAIESFSVATGNPSYRSQNGLLCSKDGTKLIAGVVGNVKIPSGVRTIGRRSFLGRGLPMTVTVPASVVTIEECAFAYCAGLTSVTMLGERPEAAGDAFQSCGKLKAIHVPAKAKSWAGMKEWQGLPLVFDAK